MAHVKIYIQKTPHIFVLALKVEEILKLYIFDHQKVGQCHGVQISQLNHSIAIVKICKCLSHIFALALTVSEI